MIRHYMPALFLIPLFSTFVIKKHFVCTVNYPLSIGVSTNLASQIMACDCCEVGLEDKPCLCSVTLIV